MTFTVDYRDVELYVGASFGFKGLFDDDGKESYESKIMTEEEFKKAYEWSNENLINKFYKVKTLEELNKIIKPNLPYYMEISNNEVIFTWRCPNRISGEFKFGFKINYASLS